MWKKILNFELRNCLNLYDTEFERACQMDFCQ